MAKREQGVPATHRRPAPGIAPAATPARRPREPSGDPPGPQRHDAPTTRGSAGDVPAGLDAARHAAAQRAAHQAEVLDKGVFAALMASALALDQFFETSAYRAYLEQVLVQAGNPADPLEKMLITQACLCHFRVAQLHVGASQAKGVEAVRAYNAVAARLLGEMRRTVLAIHAYPGRVPEDKPEPKIKLAKAAQ
jgi:hypothetical protein